MNSSLRFQYVSLALAASARGGGRRPIFAFGLRVARFVAASCTSVASCVCSSRTHLRAARRAEAEEAKSASARCSAHNRDEQAGGDAEGDAGRRAYVPHPTSAENSEKVAPRAPQQLHSLTAPTKTGMPGWNAHAVCA
jgi:hypothetical protein